jgi:hypothetical protein
VNLPRYTIHSSSSPPPSSPYCTTTPFRHSGHVVTALNKLDCGDPEQVRPVRPSLSCPILSCPVPSFPLFDCSVHSIQHWMPRSAMQCSHHGAGSSSPLPLASFLLLILLSHPSSSSSSSSSHAPHALSPTCRCSSAPGTTKTSW